MAIEQISSSSTWGKEAAKMNRNFQNLSIDVEKAKNASTRNKGLFTSESELKSAIPSPVKGDWAVVGNSIPGTVYRCTTNGTWTNTGQQGGGGDVDLTGYTKKTDFDTFKTNSESDISELQNVQTEQGAALFTLQETQQTQDNKLATLEANTGYETCSTAAVTADKIVNKAGFVLSTGCRLLIRMENVNSASDTTLNVNNTGAKTLYYNGNPATAYNTWEDGETLDVYYDGTNYQASNVLGGSGSEMLNILYSDGSAKNIMPIHYVDGYRIDCTNGSSLADPEKSVSQYLEIPDGTSQILIPVLSLKVTSSTSGYAIYDQDKWYLSGNSYPNSDEDSTRIVEINDIPAGAKFIRTTAYTKDTSLSTCVFRDKSIEPVGIIPDIQKEQDKMADEILNITSSLGESPENIAAKFTAGRGIIADSSSPSFGAGADSDKVGYSDYIECGSYKIVEITIPILTGDDPNFGLVFYDETNKAISGYVSKHGSQYGIELINIAVPVNAHSFRTTFFASDEYGEFKCTLRNKSLTDISSEFDSFKDTLYVDNASRYDGELSWSTNYTLCANSGKDNFGETTHMSNLGTSVSDFLPIQTGTRDIVISVLYSDSSSDGGCVIYNAEKEPIKGYTHQYRPKRETSQAHIYNIPPEAAYIRTIVLSDDIPNFVFKTNTSNDSGLVADLEREKSDYVLNALDYGAKENEDIKFVLFAMLEDLTNDQGRGVIYVPGGTYLLEDQVIWKSNIKLIGDGQGVTIFKPVGNKTAFTGDDLENIGFEGFTIDGELQNNGSSVYTASIKGFYQKKVRNARYRNLEIKNIFATGLGVDFFINGVIENVLCDNCGRGADLAGGNAAGASGIGVGTGAFNRGNETLVVSNCHCNNCAQYGIFFETQSGDMPFGSIVVGCTAEGNRTGFGISGGDSVVFVGCEAFKNHHAGFSYDMGTMGDVSHGTRPKFIGCIAAQNGIDIPESYPEFSGQENGFGWYIYSNFEGIELISCNSIGNLKSGIEIAGGITALNVQGGEIRNNGEHGINIKGNVSIFRIQPLLVKGNAGNGIHIDGSLSKGFIKNISITGNKNGIFKTETANLGDAIIGENFVYDNTETDDNITI